MWLWWAPLIAAVLHMTEEFVLPGGFGDWDRAYRPAIGGSITPQLHVDANLLLLVLCVSVGLAGFGQTGATIGPVHIRTPMPRELADASWVALAARLFSNAVFHVVGTIQSRHYSPGVVTGVLAYMPLAVFGSWHFILGGMSVMAALAAIVVGESYHLWASMGHKLRARKRGVLLLVAFQILPIGHLRAQVPGAGGHDHLTEVACVDVAPGEKRPEFGCFNIGTAAGLHFSQTSVYWHLRVFPNRKAAEAARSASGIVVEEDGRVWLSEFGPRNTAPRGGDAVAIVGPLQLPAATSYTAVLSYAVMRPGDNSRVHTHPGPEGWYVLAGAQCLETPAGANRARAGGTMTAPSNTPMELNVTGTALRRAFALVIHDSAQARGIPSDWKPSGACSQ